MIVDVKTTQGKQSLGTIQRHPPKSIPDFKNKTFTGKTPFLDGTEVGERKSIFGLHMRRSTSGKQKSQAQYEAWGH
jgi:hypothetical protein